MSKFMLLYLTPVPAEQQMNVSPEEMQKTMAPWLAWFGKVGNALIDGGTPLVHGTHVGKAGSAAAHAHIGGYSIVQAESLDAVKAMIKDHPHLMQPEGSIEVLEMMPMPM